MHLPEDGNMSGRNMLKLYGVYIILSSTYVERFKSFRPDIKKAAPNGKCCEGYIVPSMMRLMYQLKSVLK